MNTIGNQETGKALYHVVSFATQEVYSFEDMSNALMRYRQLGRGHRKELHVELPYVVSSESRINTLLKFDTISRTDELSLTPSREELSNPWLALAYAGACIFCNSHDHDAWRLMDEAERQLGITERVVDHSEDLLVGYWRVHAIPVGGRYGQHNEFVNTDKPGVEFYDLRHTDNELTPLGLSVCRRYVSDVLGRASNGDVAFPDGFTLHPNIPNQTLSADEMSKVVRYLESKFPTKEHSSLADQIADAQEQRAESNKSSRPYLRERNTERDL